MPFSEEQLEEYAKVAASLADLARKETLPRFRNASPVTNKAGKNFDPVTDADKEAERVMREALERTFPGHGIVGEEFGVTEGDGDWRWVLDPIDGTRAFVCGIATWTTLIALEYHGVPVASVIDQPFTGERWIAWGNQAKVGYGAQEMRTCRTSGLRDIEKARLSTTDPRVDIYFNQQDAEAFALLAGRAQLTRFSLDAYGYGLVAIGELDLIVEVGLQHHDYAALAPVITAAGGVITNWRGEPVGTDERGEAIAAASPALHAQALGLLNQ